MTTEMRDRGPIPRGFILPVGSQVVTLVPCASPRGAYPAGTTGVVIDPPADPTHSYRVRLPDGYELSLRRAELQPLRDAQAGTAPEIDLERFVIYRCVVGSRAYGLAGDDSDVDRRGFFLPPAALHWSIWGVPDQIEDKAAESCYWELQKFVMLALKANPNILECLFTPLVESATPLARDLLDMRDAFLSKLAYQTYNGYVLSQFKRLNRSVENRQQPNWKHAMHIIRLLMSGIHLVRHGDLELDVGAQREPLLAVKRGERPWAEVDAWRLQLHREFEAAFERTALPDRPDYERADAFVVRARTEALDLWT